MTTIYDFITADNGVKLILNPNKKTVEAIKSRLEVNDGICPCVPPKITSQEPENYLCPCKKCRTEGKCCCTLYVSEETASKKVSC